MAECKPTRLSAGARVTQDDRTAENNLFGLRLTDFVHASSSWTSLPRPIGHPSIPWKNSDRRANDSVSSIVYVFLSISVSVPRRQSASAVRATFGIYPRRARSVWARMDEPNA